MTLSISFFFFFLQGTSYQSQLALVYADIGPLSVKKQPCTTATLHLDDQTVEYSQLNFKAHKINPPQTEKIDIGMDNHLSAGIMIIIEGTFMHKNNNFGLVR